MSTRRDVIEELIARAERDLPYDAADWLRAQLDDEPGPAPDTDVRDLIDPLKYKFNNSPLQKGEPKGGDDDQGEE